MFLSAPKLSVGLESIVNWHRWEGVSVRHTSRNVGELFGWRSSHGHYGSFHLIRAELKNLVHREVINSWVCDIQDVTGLSSSKSDLNEFTDLDAMVVVNSKEMIDEISVSKLRQNLAHDEIRILNRDDPSDYFQRHLWDGRTFLMNDGGSHHFAAARYIAARIQHPVPLQGKLHAYSINPLALSSLLKDFDIFAIACTANLYKDFLDSMEAFSSTFLWCSLPRPFQEEKAIFLPKNKSVQNLYRKCFEMLDFSTSENTCQVA